MPGLDSETQPVAGSGAMFDRIAERYDLLNRLISLGIDQRWRRATVLALDPAAGGLAGEEILDLATGTGDLAIEVARAYPRVRVLGVDPSENMMRVGQTKLERAKPGEDLTARVQFKVGDAQALPFEDGRFAAVSMAFGIRNVPDRARALKEMARVTKKGGRIVVLELSEPRHGLLASLSRFYMHSLVPKLGALLSGASEYRYLPQSIAAFPAPEIFADMLREAGLKVVEVQRLSFGVCHLYVAEVV